MRKNFIICAVLTAAMILSPLVSMNGVRAGTDGKTEEKENVVSVMLSQNGEVKDIDEREYVVGAIAAEMDMSCHEEALKAQAVACYTYMKYRKNHEGVDGADVSDDSTTCQGYLDIEKRKEKWKDKYDEYEKKAEKAVDSVLGVTMMCDGEPIMAVYHELNSGRTESAETVWGKNIPYLQSVESAGDRLSPDYSKTVMLSLSDFKSCAVKIKGVELGKNTDEWIQDIEASDSGYVKQLTLGDVEITGTEMREAFALNSCNFEIAATEDNVTIKTLGKGHMVGMSQYGADYMAGNGSDYEEILEHYYTDIEII